MTNVSPHPGFRDVLWDFGRSSSLEDTLNVRVCLNDEELFERDDSDEGYEWRVPRGLVPRKEGRRMEPLDPQTALQAGQRLWMSLPDPVRAQTHQLGPLPLRLKISGDLKEIRYLPWECLPLMPPAIVARSVPVPYPVPPFVLREGAVRVLFVVTNPKDEHLLNPHRELAAIQVTPPQGYVHEVVSEPTLAGLERTLKSAQPHIVHYVGHGATSGGQGYLVLHDRDQHTCWVSAHELAKLLPSSVRLMCLSTCFTAENYDIRGLALFAQASPDASLPTTVVNRLPLSEASEPTIHVFWQTFYTALIQGGGDTSSAFGAAQASIRPSSDWPSFSLVIRDGTGWGLAIGTQTVETAESKTAEFDALYSTSIANYLTQQTRVSPKAVRGVLRDHSRQEAQRAQDALSSFRDFKWPGKESS